MKQSRLASICETVFGTAIGFLIAFLANVVILPLYGMNPSHKTSFWITVWFTFISLIRGYFVRRLWANEWWKRFKGK